MSRLCYDLDTTFRTEMTPNQRLLRTSRTPPPSLDVLFQKMMNECNSLVVSIPDVCGGHAILKGHRIEVSNLVGQLVGDSWTPKEWIDAFDADSWITPDEIMSVLVYCSQKQCLADGLTCCHCTLNPDEGSDPDDDSFDGWKLAQETIERLRKQNNT